MRAAMVVMLSGALAVGCGGSSDDASGGSGGDAGSGASGGSGGAGASGGSGGSSASGGSGGTSKGSCAAGDCRACPSCYERELCEGTAHAAAVQACIDAPPGTETLIIDSDPFTVNPGEELYRCQNFANPFGRDVAVVKSESFMPPGSHHMFAFYAQGATDSALEECSGLEFSRSIHTSQLPYGVFDYPEGVGTLVKQDEGIRLNAHYLNTTPNPIDATVTTVLYIKERAAVSQFSSHIFFNNFAILVGPRSTGKAEKTCKIPKDINLLGVAGHMHQFGTLLRAETGSGDLVYETESWDEPENAIFDPPMPIAKDDTITYWCDYENTSDGTLTFGDSAETDEMCILSGRYFPADDGETIECFQ